MANWRAVLPLEERRKPRMDGAIAAAASPTSANQISKNIVCCLDRIRKSEDFPTGSGKSEHCHGAPVRPSGLG